MHHIFRPYPRSIGIVSPDRALDISAIHKWASLYPEIEQLIVYSPGVQENITEKPSIEHCASLDGKEELCQVFRDVLANTNHSITKEDIDSYLRHKIEPDIIIVVGSHRLPNVLIWQSVYAELYFTNKLEKKSDFVRAVREYQGRNRRFGK